MRILRASWRDGSSPRLAVAIGGLLALVACATTLRRELVAPENAASLTKSSPYLKAHLRSGYVYVFESWSWDSTAGRTLVGSGRLLDTRREIVSRGVFRLPVDSVGLFETNVEHISGGGKALIVMAGITTAIGVSCAMDPKACFGSCPT